MFIIGITIIVFALSIFPEYAIGGELDGLAYISILLLTVGAIICIIGCIKWKTRSKVKAKYNDEDRNFCNNCKINVLNNQENCPLCGRKIKNKEN